MTAGTRMGAGTSEIPTHFGRLIDRLMDEATRGGASRRQVARDIGMNLGSIDAVIAATKPGQVWPTTIAALSKLGMSPMAMCRVIFEHDLGVSYDGGQPGGAPVLTPDELDLIRSAQPHELRTILAMLREMRRSRD